jgi:hypothetical protein
MPLPNFLIIGAAKAGTSWIARRLSQHPQVFESGSTYFFDNPINFAKGVDWYEQCFRGANGAVAIGEKTPSYLWGSKYESSADPSIVPQRVRQVIPHARLIVILRNPVSRAVSHFNYAIRTGHLSPFSDIDQVLTGRQHAVKGRRILDRGLYCRQIERWLEYFPREQMRILVLERDVMQRPSETLVDLCQFLGVDATHSFKDAHRAENQKISKFELVLKYYAPPVQRMLRPVLQFLPQQSFAPSPATSAYLTDYFAAENARLENLLGRDLSCWRRARAA